MTELSEREVRFVVREEIDIYDRRQEARWKQHDDRQESLWKEAFDLWEWG